MKAKTRRKIEMGSRALAFSIAHPDSSPGYATTLQRLEELLKRAQQLINQQRAGFGQVRGATQKKRELRKTMRRTQLMHLARVAKDALRGSPDQLQKFLVAREDTPYIEFLASARAMAAEAQNQKELLVQHGLAESLLDSLVKSIAEFDAAVEQGTEARRSHVSASAELDVIGDEIQHHVKVMDALNRFRFGDEFQLLAEWESVSNVFGPVHPAVEKAERAERAEKAEGADASKKGKEEKPAA